MVNTAQPKRDNRGGEKIPGLSGPKKKQSIIKKERSPQELLGEIIMNVDSNGNRIRYIPMPPKLDDTEHESCPPFIRNGSACPCPDTCVKSHTRLDKMPPAVQAIWKSHQSKNKDIFTFNPACCSIPNAPDEPYKLSEKGEPVKKRKMSPP